MNGAPNIPLPGPRATVGFLVDDVSFPHIAAAVRTFAASGDDAAPIYNAWARLSDNEKQLAGWCFVMEKAQAARRATHDPTRQGNS